MYIYGLSPKLNAEYFKWYGIYSLSKTLFQCCELRKQLCRVFFLYCDRFQYFTVHVLVHLTVQMTHLHSLHDKTITTFSVHTSKKYKNLHCKIILAGGTLGEKLTLICITCSCTHIYTFFKSRYAIFEKKTLLRLMYVCFAHLSPWISMLPTMTGISLQHLKITWVG